MFGTHLFGNTTIGTTQVQLLSGLPAGKNGVEVDLRADSNNTGIIYVGLNGVTSSTGWILNAGEGKAIEISNPLAIYVIASAPGQIVSYDVNYI